MRQGKKKYRQERELAKMRSQTNPEIYYSIIRGTDGVIYCQCKGWKIRKTCTHLEKYLGMMAEPSKGMEIVVPETISIDDMRKLLLKVKAARG